MLIAANIIVFVLMWLAGPYQDALVYQFAMIPSNYTNGVGLGDVMDIFTSMFMHAGLLHIGGNMLYLWIFGDNVEDRLGSAGYLMFYLVGGVAASLLHLFTNPGSQIPTVGASGAIAAVLGAYLVLYPGSRIVTYVALGKFARLTWVPAIIVLSLWFIMQLFEGLMSFGGADVGGVAVWAHIGGFIAGMVMAKFFTPRYRTEYTVNW
jgi:membrane associated rhomboid family serine protease